MKTSTLSTCLLLVLASLVPSLYVSAFVQPFHKGATVPSDTALTMALTLYGHPGTRSPLCNWAANEIGISLAAGDLSRNPHPFGQIPCLTDDDNVLVFESGAILIYLLDNVQNLSKSERAAIIAWITWANASLDSVCFLETPEGKVYDTGFRKPNKRIAQLEAILSKQDYLVPSCGFSLADVAVASYLLYVLQFFPDVDLSPWPAIMKYIKECASRQGYGDAFGKPTQARLVELISVDARKKKFGMF
jgi:glutathione S-transferase